MSLTKFLRIPKQEAHMKVMKTGLVRESVSAEAVEIQEPAPERFDCPTDEGAWRRIKPHEHWGGAQQWAYFRTKIEVPKHWPNEGVELKINLKPYYLADARHENTPTGPEGMVFINGARAGAVDQCHDSMFWNFEPGKTYDIRAAIFAARCECSHIFGGISLRWRDPEANRLYTDLRMILDILKQGYVEETSPAWEVMLQAVERAMEAVDIRELSETSSPHRRFRDEKKALFHQSIPAAREVFDEAIAALHPHPRRPVFRAVGHAHIDLAWLWTYRRAMHKCVHSFTTQVRLLEQYPDWVFLQSSAQVYQWLEQETPDLFETIKDLIKRGRWEADGAMWCESDTYLAGGEALVRQLVYGKRYFKEKLGVDSRMLWLPDCFGYTASLPQILKLAGVDGFATSKISWNHWNRFPHDTFKWRGIDGTEIATHFISTPTGKRFEATYNGQMTLEQIHAITDEYRHKELEIKPLMSFGWGDGGGGPTEAMLETARRVGGELPLEGMPRLEHGKAAELFDEIREKMDQLPTWVGELYLETHRGCFTSQAWLKRANRKNEIRLHQLEWLAAVAGPEVYRVDKARLDELWRVLLLTHFHDVLPGSSVSEVYETEVRPMHEWLEKELSGLIDEVSGKLAQQIDPGKAREPVALFNTLSWDRNDAFQLPDGRWLDGIEVPAGGWRVIDLAESTGEDTLRPNIAEDGLKLENRFWRVQLNERGEITELYDKRAERQVLRPGSVGNQLQMFEDRPMNSDNWDIEHYYEEDPRTPPQATGHKIVEESDCRVAVEFSYALPKIAEGPVSTITQRIAIYAHTARIDFETEADWHEHHELLKVAFPVAVYADEAAYQSQFGHTMRETHRNTSWQYAKFEVPAHQFADLSEYGYGVSLLNDCKYGYDIHDGVMRLTLIKCGQEPDFRADQGHHVFTYSLYPHRESLQEGGTIQAAAELNNPILVKPLAGKSGKQPAEFRLIEKNSEAAVVETIKPAEDGQGIIVRIYEAHGSRGRIEMKLARAVKKVTAVNLLEEPMEDEGLELEFEEGTIGFNVEPFKIVSLRVES